MSRYTTTLFLSPCVMCSLLTAVVITVEPLRAVAAMLEECPRILFGNLRKRFPDRVNEDLADACSGLPEQVLDLGERLLYRIEVRRVGRQVEDLGASPSIISLTVSLLWTERLSITTISPSLSAGMSISCR